MIPFFKKKVKESTPPTFEHDEESGVLRIEHDGKTDGKGNLSLLEEFAKHRNFPIFKGKVENAFESDFLGYKDKCPLCNTATVQHYSSFIWANQIASRLMAAPAGHFCPNCPTVIIDDDIMKSGVNKARFQYWGTCAIETGYEEKKGDTNLFRTLNGEKVTYVLDQDQGLNGILNSVHAPSGQNYLSSNEFDTFSSGIGNINLDRVKNIQAKKKKENSKKKNKQAKQSRKANRKK